MALAEDTEPAEWLAASTRRFDAMYRENVRVVYAYARARLGVSEGEEVVSEVFHAAVVAFRSGRAEMVTAPWLMAVARNKVIDRWRRAERRMAKSHLLRTDGVVFQPDWGNDEEREIVLAALAELKHRHRALLILHHLDGLPIVEIAEEFGESPSAVESALARARQAFRREYRKLIGRGEGP